jgi:acyl carrier protein
MAEQGVRHLVLVGRKGLPDRASWPELPEDSEAGRRAAAVRAIEGLGATVQVVAADVSDRKQMSTLLEQFGRSAPPLRGIIHAAVAARSDALRDMTLDQLRSVFRPKVVGAWVLHDLTATMDLDFFVLFSSTTALLGVRDLGHYAAANTFLDALAHQRKAGGRPALSINWGVWDEVQAGSVEQQRALTGAGLRPMPAASALKILGRLLTGAPPQVVVAAVDWATLKAVYETKKRRPFLEQLGSAPSPKRTAVVPEQGDLRQRLEAARPQDRWDVLVSHVRAEVARVLRLEPQQTIELHRGLFDLGMDSLMSVELKSRLEASVGRTLPSTLTFNYPNVGALAEYLAKEVLSLQPVQSPTSPAGPEEPAATTPTEGDDLSEDELATRLAEKLAQIR